MYYDLTKEEYKEYSKKFRKTYIGKRRFMDKIAYSILSAYFTLCFGIDYIIAGVKEIEYRITYDNIFLLIVIVLFASLEIVSRILYDKDLKEYINTKRKD